MAGLASLEQLLEDLQAVCTSTSPQRAVEAKSIAADLVSLCTNATTQEDLAFVSSSIFHPERGILAFLRLTATADEYDQSKEALLTYLAQHIRNIGRRISDYAADIKSVCLSLFRQDRKSRVKNATFEPLLALVELSLSADQLGAAQMATFFMDEYISGGSKLQSTVKANVLELLGSLCASYPEVMADTAPRLQGLYLGVVREQMGSSSKKTDMALLGGALRGITACMVNFPVEGRAKQDEVYGYILKAIRYQPDLSRYEVPRAGFRFLCKHAGRFRDQLGRDALVVYGALSAWVDHRNYELQKDAADAMCEVLKQVAQVVDSLEDGKKIFLYFIREFRAIVQAGGTVGSPKASIAIRGYGYFAGACGKYMDVGEVRFMFNDIVHKGAQGAATQGGRQGGWDIEDIPALLESLASIILALPEIDETLPTALTELFKLLFGRFRFLRVARRQACYVSLAKLFAVLYSKGDQLQLFASTAFYIGLLETLSVDVVAGVTDQELSEDTVGALYELWANMLDSTAQRDITPLTLGLDDRQRLYTQLYDEFMRCILRVVSQLNLRVDHVDTDQPDTTTQQQPTESADGTAEVVAVVPVADPTGGLRAANPRDFQVLIHLVEFCKRVLPDTDPQRFSRWAYLFGYNMIELANKYPMASGLYKLFAICLQVCERIGYFDSVCDSQPTTSSRLGGEELEGATLSDTKACQMLFTKFVKEVLVRMRQYKADLLAACLQCVLALPPGFLQPLLADIVPALNMALGLGLAYLPLALAAVDCLDTWIQVLPRDALTPHWSTILPSLDGYLVVSSDVGQQTEAEEAAGLIIALRQSRRMRKNRRDMTQATTIDDVRVRILQLLGRIGGSANIHLLPRADLSAASEGQGVSAYVSWDSVMHLHYGVSFPDTRIDLHLDPLLPRLVALAEGASDRPTKVAAGELLHSIILLMVGRGTQQTGQDQEEMYALYTHIMPAILRLGCDVEHVSQQLYATLAHQLVHWFSGPVKLQSPETKALLDAIVDGLADSKNSALREFCGGCVNEFILWSIKQTSYQEQSKQPMSVKSVLKKLYSMMMHANAFKRIGGCLAFNESYKVIGSEPALVDVFCVELFHYVFYALRLADQDDPALGTGEQARRALLHLLSIAKRHNQLLLKQTKLRRVPPKWTGDATLGGLVVWAMDQTGCIEEEARRQAMHMVNVLAPLLPGTASDRVWVQAQAKKGGSEYFVKIFEKEERMQAPLGRDLHIEGTVVWYRQLQASLELYTWLLGGAYLLPEDLFGKNANSSLFDAVHTFLQHHALMPTDSKQLRHLTPRERERFHRHRCTAICCLLTFVSTVLERYPTSIFGPRAGAIPTALIRGPFLDLLIRATLVPRSLGFDFTDQNIRETLPRETGNLLMTMGEKMPESVKDEVEEAVAREIANDRHDPTEPVNLATIPDHGGDVDVIHVTTLVSGYEQLYGAGFLGRTMTRAEVALDPDSFVEKVLKMDCRTPARRDVAHSLLRIGLVLYVKRKRLLELLLAQRGGGLVLDDFRHPACAYLVRNYQQFAPLILECERRTALTVMLASLDVALADRSLRTYRERFLRALLSGFGSRPGWWVAGENSEDTQNLLLLLSRIIRLDGAALLLDREANPALADMNTLYCGVLTDKASTLAFKAGRPLQLLATIARVGDPYTTQLKTALDTMVDLHFPLTFSEFQQGSATYKEAIAGLDSLLEALVQSCSPILLRLLIALLGRESSHAHEDGIVSALSRYATNLDVDGAVAALDMCMEFISDPSFRHDIRWTICQRFATTILKKAAEGAVEEFFCRHISALARNLGGPDRPSSSEKAYHGQLVSRACSHHLVGLMYARLQQAALHTAEGKVVKAYMAPKTPTTGKELTMAIVKAAHGIRSEIPTLSDPVTSELWRRLCCCAYNALSAVILLTQTKPDTIAGFLFRENERKGEILWARIINTSDVPVFPVELDTALRRVQWRQMRDGLAVTTGRERDQHYLPSQILFDSSLSQDASLFGLGTSGSYTTATIQKTGPSQQQATDASSTPVASQDGGGASATSKASVEGGDQADGGEEGTIEMDVVNRHECMLMILRTVDLMHTVLCKPPEDENQIRLSDMPKWMDEILRKLEAPDTDLAIRVYLAKIVLNRPSVFRPYAKAWLRPLIILARKYGKSVNNGINYLIVDLCALLLSWSDKAMPEAADRSECTALLRFLMENAYHEKPAVLSNNVLVIKTMVECWKDLLDIPTLVIFNQLSAGSDQTSKRSIVGIQLLGVVVANDIPAFVDLEETARAGLSRERFFGALVTNLGNKYKDVYRQASEVVGMVFQQHDADPNFRQGAIYNLVVAGLRRLVEMQDQARFVTCLYFVHVAHPAIVDLFATQLFFLLPSLYGEYRAMIYEMVASRAEHIDDLFVRLKPHLLGMIQHRDVKTQRCALRSIHTMLSRLDTSQIEFFLPTLLETLGNLDDLRCMQHAFSILEWLHDHGSQPPRDPLPEEMQKGVVTELLKCLTHRSSVMREKAYAFWNQEARMRRTFMDRLEQLVGSMYSPATEQSYLNYATALLLDLCEHSIDYNAALFDKPLSACKFRTYAVQTRWDQRFVPMTPLFANTQASQTQSLAVPPSYVDMADGQLRATQAPMTFTQTTSQFAYGPSLEAASFSPADIMTMDEDADRTSRLFRKRVREKFAEKMSGSQQGSAAPSPSVDQSQDIRQLEFARLRRRFVKGDEQSSNMFHARMQARKNREVEKMRKMQKVARANQVTLYRTYRIGELPDIQIMHRDLLGPLKTVCQKDANIAREVFVALFRPVFDKIDTEMTASSGEQKKKTLQASLGNMMGESRQHHPPFVGGLLQICYDIKQLTLPPSLLATISVGSYNQPLGIMVLEKQIANHPVEERPTKRARTAASQRQPSRGGDRSTWLELARVYRSVGEYDVLRGIYKDILAGSGTEEAIECEGRGDYEAAEKVYATLLSQSDGSDEENVVGGLVESLEETASWATLCAHLRQWHGSLDLFDTNGPVWDHPSKDLLIGALLHSYYAPDSKSRDVKDLAGQFIDATCSAASSHKEYMEAKFTQELAYAWAARRDADRARYYVSRAYSAFLADWSAYHPLMVQSRQQRLQSLQQMVELDEYLTFLAHPHAFTDLSLFHQFQQQWVGRLPSRNQHSVRVWAGVVEGRSMALDAIMTTYEKQHGHGMDLDSQGDDELSLPKLFEMATDLKFSTTVAAAAASRHQSNFRAAKNLTKQALGFSADPTHHLALTHELSLANCAQVAMDAFPAVDGTVRMLKVLVDLCQSDVSSVSAPTVVEHHLIKARASELLGSHVTSLSPSDLLALRNDPSTASLLSEIGMPESGGVDAMYKAAMESTYMYLDEGVEASATAVNKQSKAYLRLTEFCDTMLTRLEDGTDKHKTRTLAGQVIENVFPEKIMWCTLKGMAAGNRKATEWFPRVLLLLEQYPEIGSRLEQESTTVPSWLFIGWISQMIALLSKPVGDHVGEILLSIAQSYPEALSYPFQISCEQLSTSNPSKYVQRIESVLQNPVRDRFVAELERLTYPEHSFKDWVDNEFRPASTAKDRARLAAAFKKLTTTILTSGATEVIHRRFREQWSKQIYDVTKQDGAGLFIAKPDAFDRIIPNMAEDLRKRGTGALVKDFSRWLAEFQASDYPDHPIEIPGQYGGSQQPNPDHHVRLLSVDEGVLVLQSIRKPKRIKFRGNDEKDYPFLVKGGEDLRLDQRIEQIFGTINAILQEDSATYQRQLYLRTYKVVPMTMRVGIIEWMTGTMTLKDVLQGAMTPAEKLSNDKNPPVQVNVKWIEKYAKNPGDRYPEMFRRASRTEVEENLKHLCSMVPCDLLRRALLARVQGLEAFVAVRSEFARSHAVLCVCHYIVGIGDRHMSNFMFDTNTGRMVGIDFGHAFGSATILLPVPELVPFRLTQQIVNVLHPHGTQGLMRSTMVAALRAMQAKRQLLLRVMHVFVNEPLLEWEAEAQKTAQNQGERSDTSWYPKEKLSVVQMKLQRTNPTLITCRELELGAKKSTTKQKTLPMIKKIVQGDVTTTRSQVGPVCASVEQQVDCLIEMATDPNILGRCWHGWEAWM